MDYIAAGPIEEHEEHIRRVMNRAALGGHSASEKKLRNIYENSMKNLGGAFEENQQENIDVLRIFDNSKNFGRPRLVVSLVRGVPKQIAADLPAWLESAVVASRSSVAAWREAMRTHQG